LPTRRPFKPLALPLIAVPCLLPLPGHCSLPPSLNLTLSLPLPLLENLSLRSPYRIPDEPNVLTF